MIDGITVLNQTEITKINIPFMLVMAVILIIIAVVLIWTIGATYLDFAGPIICFLLIGILLIAGVKSQKYTGEYEYDVLIDDRVSMIEFTQRYQIIEQNGKIFTIIKKGN